MTLTLKQLIENPSLLDEERKKWREKHPSNVKRDANGWRMSADGMWVENPASWEQEHSDLFFDIMGSLLEDGRYAEMESQWYVNRQDAEPYACLR